MLLREINRLCLYLEGAGSWKLTALESLVIDAVVKHLDGVEGEAVQKQLRHKFFVERSNPRINVIRFYDDMGPYRLADVAFEDALYKVTFVVDGKKQTANVTFYRRLLFSVETRRPGKEFRNKSVSISDVKQGKASQTLTRVIDRAVHGSME